MPKPGQNARYADGASYQRRAVAKAFAMHPRSGPGLCFGVQFWL